MATFLRRLLTILTLYCGYMCGMTVSEVVEVEKPAKFKSSFEGVYIDGTSVAEIAKKDQMQRPKSQYLLGEAEFLYNFYIFSKGNDHLFLYLVLQYDKSIESCIDILKRNEKKLEQEAKQVYDNFWLNHSFRLLPLAVGGLFLRGIVWLMPTEIDSFWKLLQTGALGTLFIGGTGASVLALGVAFDQARRASVWLEHTIPVLLDLKEKNDRMLELLKNAAVEE